MALGSRRSRRDVLKLTAYSTAGALLGAPAVRAQTKSLTMMHESSFVPPYDAFFKNKLATAYEKAHGVTYPSIFDPSGRIALRFTKVPPSSIPSTIVIDKSGRIAAIHVGPVTGAALTEMISKASS